MSFKKVLLNKFEKKTVINALSSFNVVNLVLDINIFGDVHYIIFYTREDTLFSLSVEFDNRVTKDANLFSNFLNICKNKLEHTFKNSHFYFKYNAPLDSNEILLSSLTISRNIAYLIHNIKFFELSSHSVTISSTQIDEILETVLREGFSAKDSFSHTYKKLNIDIVSILENIKSHNHALEIR